MNWKRIELIFELLIFGIILGITEDLIVIKLATDVTVNWRVILIVVLVAVPFAIVGEIVIDRIDFIKIFKKTFRRDGEKHRH